MEKKSNRKSFFRQQGLPIFLVVFLIVISFYSYYSTTRLKSVHAAEIAELLEEHQMESDQANKMFQDLEKEFKAAQSDYNQVSERYSGLRDRHTALKLANSAAIADLAVANRRIKNLENAVLCTRNNKTFHPNYAGHAVMAESLMNWVREKIIEDDGESITRNSWEKVFSNAEFAIHYVHTTNYLFVFVVYIEESGRVAHGVFWLSGQCWLDLQENQAVD